MSARRRERGLALVTVLWAVTLLSLMAATVLSAARMETKIASYLIAEGQAEAIADGVANKAIYELLRPPNIRAWEPDGQRHTYAFGGVDATVIIKEELEKIDLNNADETLLTSLFVSAGVDDGDAQALAAAIGDWRDPDDLVRLNGAEARDYRLAGLDYAPSNGLFETIDEVRWVRGMTDDIYACVAPALTVYSGRSGISSSAQDTLVVESLRRTFGEDVTAKTPPSRKTRLMSLDGRAFEILVEVPMGRLEPYRRKVVIRITGDRQEPYWVYAWERVGRHSEEKSRCTLAAAS